MSAESIAARAALELGLPADDERVTAAVDAAIGLASIYVYGTTDHVGSLPLHDPVTSAGLVALAVRIHLDPRSPAGSLESDVYAGVNLPEDLLTHVHGYFDHLRTTEGFGVS
jgi:hypothetical protein